jgi:hypothetical protein
MSSRTIIAMVAAVVVTTGVTALPATGQDAKPSGTLTFTGKASKRDQTVVDVRPKGIGSATGSSWPRP